MRRRLATALLLTAVAGGGGTALITTAADSAPSTTASASASGVVVRFHLSGGFVGRDERTTITSARRVTVTSRDGSKRHTVKASTLTALRRTLDAAHVERKLDLPDSGCADCFVYAITYKGHTLTFDESDQPARLAKATAELSRIAGGGR